MSRRRETWQPAAGIESDELLTAMYGQQYRQAHTAVRGCSGRCCAPGAMAAESRIGSVVWRWIGSEIVVVVAVLALIAVAGRGRVW